jgi:hypothetical protein
MFRDDWFKNKSNAVVGVFLQKLFKFPPVKVEQIVFAAFEYEINIVHTFNPFYFARLSFPIFVTPCTFYFQGSQQISVFAIDADLNTSA